MPIEDLRHLPDAPDLTEVDFSDNPFTSLPNYRETAISQLPSCKTLDSLPIERVNEEVEGDDPISQMIKTFSFDRGDDDNNTQGGEEEEEKTESDSPLRTYKQQLRHRYHVKKEEEANVQEIKNLQVWVLSLSLFPSLPRIAKKNK